MNENRVVFGTDYPFPLGEVDKQGDVFESELGKTLFDKETRSKFAWKNCCEFLGRSDLIDLY